MTFAQAEPGISDNNWLDQFRIPVGNWFTQTVDWVDGNLGWLLDAFKVPFDVLFRLFMSDNPNRDSIMSISWLWLVLGFFLLGSVMRNTRIGLMSGAMVAACGFLGQGFWFDVSKTFGMIFVSVLLCAVVGLPLGVLCGRFDSIWNVTRPVLDAMQVVHSFVWMLPFIAFWGTGEVSGTMVTMLFAMPPLVRLTNLGIRQVPEDVVEASRSYGATELRVLTDVQLPLARPAIMTGLNQTLLYAISMLGIIALMGADGLGKLIYRAINNLDTGLAASAGLAYFFVAVVLDRISQPEADDGMGLFGRIGHAWEHRGDAEGLLASLEEKQAAAGAIAPPAEPAERPVPLTGAERSGLMAVIAGAGVMIVGTLLTWSSDAGLVSSWGRAADESLPGQSFNGVSGHGGNFFGILVFGMAVLALLAALRPLLTLRSSSISEKLNSMQGVLMAALGAMLALTLFLNLIDQHSDTIENVAFIVFGVLAVLILLDTFVRGTPRLGTDGAAIMSLGALGPVVGFILLSPPDAVTSVSIGIGAYVALIGAVVAVGGAIMSMVSAPYDSSRPMPLGISWPAAGGLVVIAALVIIGASAAWIADEREGFRNREFLKGLEDGGPMLGWPTLGFALLGLLAAVALLLAVGERATLRWRAGTVTAGLGLAVVSIPLAWTFSMSRTGDTDYFSDRNALTGAGVLFALMGGMILFSIGVGAIKHFRRRKIYADAGPKVADAIEVDVTDRSTRAGTLEGANS